METLTKPKTKKKAKKPPKEVTSIRLDPILHARAKQFAEAEKRSFSQYVELALEQYVTEAARKQQQELAKHVQPGDVHGVWSAHDEFKAAEQMQAFLESTRS